MANSTAATSKPAGSDTAVRRSAPATTAAKRRPVVFASGAASATGALAANGGSPVGDHTVSKPVWAAAALLVQRLVSWMAPAADGPAPRPWVHASVLRWLAAFQLWRSWWLRALDDNALGAAADRGMAAQFEEALNRAQVAASCHGPSRQRTALRLCLRAAREASFGNTDGFATPHDVRAYTLIAVAARERGVGRLRLCRPSDRLAAEPPSATAHG